MIRTMTNNSEKIPLDAKLLSYAIIELNISRRNVAIYPKEHPSVERSLNNAFKFLQQLFGLRPEITLAIAKDTIIIDEYQLDKKNPVFREFALTLHKMNIAYLVFKTGITKDELYRFHSLLTEQTDNLTVNNLKEVSKNYNLIHIDIGAVDYHKFSTGDRTQDEQTNKVPLWERYVYGLLEGKLRSETVSDEIRDIPPEILARILNKSSNPELKEEAYDQVIATYLRGSHENIFSGQDLRRLIEFINRLTPDLKKKFLSSTVQTFSKDAAAAYQALSEISIEEIEGFLGVVNQQKIAMPQSLMELISKLSHSDQTSSDTIYIDEDELEDEGFLSSNLEEVFSRDATEKDAEPLVTGTDLREIQELLQFDASVLKASNLMEFENEFNEDLIEKRFSQIILEMMYSETVSEEEYLSLVNIIKEKTEQLLWIGQFGQFLEILKVIELNKALYRFAAINSEALQHYHSPEFIVTLIDSFRILGRQKRKEVSMICAYYDKEIISYLLDALAEEDSLTIRRFIMELIKQFGKKIIPEAAKRLSDDRWFVIRNMLYILGETDSREVIDDIKPFCRHENLKVSIPAIRCLLNAGDTYAKNILREYLGSKSKPLFEQAVALSGSFRIKEFVGDLIRLLNKQVMTGDDILAKIPVIRALGDIGDPQAVDALRVLVSSKSILFKSTTDRMKEEIYKTLKNYPYESVKDLVDVGLASKNELIREESSRLQRERAG
jgi:hypothetical protein